MFREFELKLELDPASEGAVSGLPILQGGSAGRQLSTYFDTDDGALRAKALSLRVRTLGSRRIQTLKADPHSAAGLFDRPEWEKPVEADMPDLHGVDDTPFSALLGDIDVAALRPIFTVDVTRTLWRLERDTSEIELVFDAGTLRANGASTPVCEFECELKSGRAEALFDLAQELARHLPLRIGVLTKSERGRRLGDGSLLKPSKAEPVALDAGMNAAEAFRTICSSCIRHFRLNEPLVVGTREADALHQARVAMRRLRSAFSLFRDVIADERAPALRQELRWLSGELGKARDLDVLIERLDDGGDRTRLLQAREAAYDSVADALASARVRTLMLELVAWLNVGAWQSPPDATAAKRLREPVGTFAADVLRRYRRKVRRKGGDLAALSPEERHRVRIEVKKLRYAAEFFTPLVAGKKERRRLKAFLGALADMQASLGSLNDIATASEIEAMHPAGGAKQAPSQEEIGSLLREAAEAHERFVDVKPFWKS